MGGGASQLTCAAIHFSRRLRRLERARRVSLSPLRFRFRTRPRGERDGRARGRDIRAYRAERSSFVSRVQKTETAAATTALDGQLVFSRQRHPPSPYPSFCSWISSRLDGGKRVRVVVHLGPRTVVHARLA